MKKEEQKKLIIESMRLGEETLEEAAQERFPVNESDDIFEKYGLNYASHNGFIEGAKWQEEQFKEIIDGLQEKYDENGYNANLINKLLRVEQHFDATVNILANLSKEMYTRDEMFLFAGFVQGKKYSNPEMDLTEIMEEWEKIFKSKSS